MGTHLSVSHPQPRDQMFPHLSLPQAMAPDPLQEVTEVGNVSVLLDVALGIGAAP